MNRTKIRHQLFLDPDLSARLEALAAKPGVSKSTILADAVTAWLNRRGSQELDERFGLRLHRISDQLDRIERDGQVLLESLALFVRYQLTVTAPLPEPDKAARAVGQERFQKFIDQVGRQIAARRRTLSGDQEGDPS
ncbi:CopG family transcriptional regulator [Pararhodospirillum photometricum]|uniref:Helix-turn-helix protein, CopG n=1 Tax=Pararhodospirillum photometricum DSM 122 TaxID=1150469 RepID=H6SKT8_PARPM|nr:CopG family transcriptional regulator [Pararhodospirillum photometricum]CCG08603.1 Helix-turn-helix protein, CopG [Pararhodospirillum photometricum DSM 122]